MNKIVPTSLTIFLLLLLSLSPCKVLADPGFRKWLEEFYPLAAKEGVSRETYRAAFATIHEVDPVVLEKAAYQPEFTTKIWDYLDARVNSLAVGRGQEMARRHGKTLATVEARFGVEQQVLLAIWSMESGYGAALERHDRLHYVPQALATLAYRDKKRQKFARNQLVAALQILQAGDISIKGFHGSWAGAMGHTQFIPTSYLAYGVDMDGDGRRDIWNSIPDALATAANLLAKNGWRSGRPWGYEVRLPAGGEKLDGQTKTLAEWRNLGFAQVKGGGFSQGTENAELKLPAGPSGPAFLLMKNFFVFKRYNNADAYALAVGLLADQLAGRQGVVQDWPRPPGSLNMEEKLELQRLLKAKGYYQGEVDGNLGAGSRQAIEQFQASAGVVVDGEPNRKILKSLRQ